MKRHIYTVHALGRFNIKDIIKATRQFDRKSDFVETGHDDLIDVCTYQTVIHILLSIDPEIVITNTDDTALRYNIDMIQKLKTL